MSKFTAEEKNLICIYNTGSRVGLLSELSEMRKYLEADEIELLDLTKTVLDKLSAMRDTEFENVIDELVADFKKF